MLDFERIDELADEIGQRYDKLQDELMEAIISKVKDGLKSGEALEWDVSKYLETGGAWQTDIEAKIQKATGLAQEDVEKLLKDAGLESIVEDNKHLPEGHKLAERLSDSQLRIIEAGIKNVNGQIGNMANVAADSAFSLYSDLLTEGYTMLSSGAFTLDEAVEKVGTKLVNQGVKGIEYASGRKDTIEVAVRRALRTSVNQTMLNLGEKNAEEAGTDLVEVSAHAGARPEHAAWQGKVYSLSGKTKGYQKLSDATGYGTITGLGGVNCRHNFYPYYPGYSKTEYSGKELSELKSETVSVNGETMPLYQATQLMRSYERQYRKQVRLEEIAGKDTADRQLEIKSKIRLLSQQTGIQSNPGRLEVYL